ncbi:MAG: response regulator [Candidatus Omnitrophica bacterium]|nr:response regulator [Candidatus Omnitrophota bacterium]
MIWKKILVIEDDVTLRNKFYEIFFNKGQEVHCVPTAKEAFAVLTEHRFDLILLDYSLPDAKAVQTVQKIREFNSDVRIILLYDQVVPDDEKALFKSMAVVDLIKKDFSTHFMMKEILEILRSFLEDDRPKTPAKFAKASILVVDDNEEIRKVLETFLSKRGYSVRSAVSGEDALFKIKIEKPEIVFLDFRMPGMDGVMTLNQIKRLDDAINVIMLTSVQDEYVMDEVRREGACEFLIKPCDLSKLDALITSILLQS